MLTCQEASFLISKKLDGKLAWREHLGLYLHISLCSLCRRYLEDVKRLRSIMRAAGKYDQVLLPESVRLSAQSRERIKQALRNVLQKMEQ
jgi:predicted anti-sigma-YlaC factor YlaD